MTKRLDAIRQRLPEPTTNEACKQDIEYLLSLVEKYEATLNRIATKAVNKFEPSWWIAQQALKCDEGGEVGE